jgi:hypothetical protein
VYSRLGLADLWRLTNRLFTAEDGNRGLLPNIAIIQNFSHVRGGIALVLKDNKILYLVVWQLCIRRSCKKLIYYHKTCVYFLLDKKANSSLMGSPCKLLLASMAEVSGRWICKEIQISHKVLSDSNSDSQWHSARYWLISTRANSLGVGGNLSLFMELLFRVWGQSLSFHAIVF